MIYNSLPAEDASWLDGVMVIHCCIFTSQQYPPILIYNKYFFGRGGKPDAICNADDICFDSVFRKCFFTWLIPLCSAAPAVLRVDRATRSVLVASNKKQWDEQSVFGVFVLRTFVPWNGGRTGNNSMPRPQIVPKGPLPIHLSPSQRKGFWFGIPWRLYPKKPEQAKPSKNCLAVWIEWYKASCGHLTLGPLGWWSFSNALEKHLIILLLDRIEGELQKSIIQDFNK